MWELSEGVRRRSLFDMASRERQNSALAYVRQTEKVLVLKIYLYFLKCLIIRL